MSSVLRVLAWLPHVAVTVLMLVAMVDMLLGVFLRYVMTWVSARFDLPSVRFFWVEEVGEYALAWLTFIGAAIGIRRGTHFAVQILTERLPPRLSRAIHAGHYVLLDPPERAAQRIARFLQPLSTTTSVSASA